MIRGWWTVIVILSSQVVFILGIRLKNVTIPHYGVQDGIVRLGCEFVLDSDTLMVLKWYKDELEFFRYTPSSAQQILTFPRDGVFVDESQSGLNHVVLRNVTLNTTGLYKCEVSVDGSFRTLHGQGNMVVIAPPKTDPTINGVRQVVNVGDLVNGNCTSRRSKPAAVLMFYINKEKIEQDLVDYAPYTDPDGLETSFIGFNLIVEPRHFKNGIMFIECTATIGNFYWVTSKNVSNANINAQPSFTGHVRLSSSGATATANTNNHFSSIAYKTLISYGSIVTGLLIL